MRFSRPFFLLLGLLPVGALALTLHVDPSGDDRWSGRPAQANADRTDGPLASLDGARQAVRKLPHPLTEPVEVLFAAGTYRVTQAVAFDGQDSGEPGKGITYAAAPGAEVVISGGRPLPGFTAKSDGRWELTLPAGVERFEQLWVGDRRATRARVQNPGKHFLLGVESETRLPSPPNSKAPAVYEQRLRLAPSELQAFAGATPEQVKDAVATFYHKWDSTRRQIESVDVKEGLLTIRGRALKANTSFDHLTGIVLENLPSLLDEPGEWFLGRDGVLSYRPRPGETPATAAVIPVADKLLTFTGTAAAPVRHLSFRGLKFRHAKGVPTLAVAEPNQAAVATVDAVVTLEHARQVAFTGCELSHFASYGVSLRQGCREVVLDQCLLTDMGAGGVKIGTPGDQSAENHTSHNRVHNCIIRDGGLFFPCAVGVWIGSSSDNEVTHNEISDLFYSAVSVGWRWGYAPSSAKRNRVEWNHLHHLGRGMLSDMGGVYTLGLSEGTSVSHNLIHDVTCFSYGGWGLYTDEGSSGITMEGNITYNTTDGGFHQHYGRENIIRNNVFAFSEEAQVKRTRDETHLSFTFEKNIIVFDRGELLGSNWNGDTSRFLLRNNVYWDYSGRPLTFPKKQTFEAWQKTGQDVGSIVADPKFADVAARDFRLAADSPALALGIQPIDSSKMGVIGPEWRKVADSFERPDSAPRPDRPIAPSLNIRQDFEGRITDIRTPFPYSHGSTSAAASPPGQPRKSLGDALTLTTAKSSEGKQSLLFLDAPGLPAGYMPMLTFTPNHRGGVSTVSFDLFLEPKAVFVHEWRNKASPYATGPVVHIRDGKLTGPKGLSVDFPLQTWVKVEISAPIGPQTPARWTLRLTPQGGETREFKDLPFRNPTMTTLDWVGFSSAATERTEFYLDNLSITTTEPTR